jgi:hypothetical protein
MQKRSFRSGNTFSYPQANACFRSPGSFPMAEFSQKKRIKISARFLLSWKKSRFTQKMSTNLFSLSGDHYYYYKESAAPLRISVRKDANRIENQVPLSLKQYTGETDYDDGKFSQRCCK